ncbi:unnamed protein product [Polarella glacialis]|uniref:Uncharacterized protein n=1 Tax=Polarella glacialis TaxID=89957 RepID=A0A813F5R5_POLGL|nr:unnamed protein product [Polarella glacialis]
MIEDLINSVPFTCYAEWREQQDLEMVGPWGPTAAGRSGRCAMGRQEGALAHRAALPPVVSFGLPPDTHFERSREAGASETPMEARTMADDDLHFAAYKMWRLRGQLTVHRKRAVGAIRELQRRWAPVTKQLRRWQPPSALSVTRARDVGLIGLLTILLLWPDVTLAPNFICGFPAVGYSPACDVFPARSARLISREEVLAEGEEDAISLLKKVRQGPEDDFLLEASEKDRENGFSGNQMTAKQLRGMLQGRRYRLIRRFCVKPSTGKSRACDDADEGKQSALSSDANKLELCAAFRPAQHMTLVHDVAREAGHSPSKIEDEWESGGEDWPDAYRYTPMSPEDAYACIVVIFHPILKQPVFYLYFGLLFGLPLAVTPFNRWPKCCEALSRRLLMTLVSFYFDDATVQDWASSKGSGQLALRQTMTVLGTPFAEAKQQQMSSHSDFLGLEHDLVHARAQEKVTFWVRERLQTKILDFIKKARADNRLASGVASKLYGCSNFFEQAVYGKIGRAGLNSVKDRQYDKLLSLTPAIEQAFEVLEAIMKERPVRTIHLTVAPVQRFVVASDAALEIPRHGAGGYLEVWRPLKADEYRSGFVVTIPEGVYDLWSAGVHRIAQLELLMVLVALVSNPNRFRGRRGVWFIDNTAALIAMVRGRSDSADLDRLALIIHAAMFALEVWIYFEWIETKSNRSDGISRDAENDKWHVENKFSTEQCSFPLCHWKLPLRALIRVFAFL